MAMENVVKDPLPHHEQQELCTSRLPYRQGRKLTAVKVYTINSESNHLLIFGVPSINLRQETKALFMKFGKITQFSLHKDYKSEKFTETYHAVYENIKSARIAKKMLDTKNFYGSNLHVCYAPELESFKETFNKLFQRKKDVLYRLKNLKQEDITLKNQLTESNIEKSEISKNISPIIVNEHTYNRITLNMGNQNVIYLNNNKKRKSRSDNPSIKKKSKTANHNASFNTEASHNDNEEMYNSVNQVSHNHNEIAHNDNHSHNANIEIIDFTSTERETLSNINEALNYNKFGNEVIRKVENKPLNVIKFNFIKKS